MVAAELVGATAAAPSSLERRWHHRARPLSIDKVHSFPANFEAVIVLREFVVNGCAENTMVVSRISPALKFVNDKF